MSYCFLVAGIATTVEPTENLLKPVKHVIRYTSDATLYTFDDEDIALARAREKLSDDVIVITGTRDGLILYEQLWMGISEECLHDPKYIATRIRTGTPNWKYGASDATSFADALKECDEMESSKPAEPNSRPRVGSYSMTNSSLVSSKFSSTFYLFHESMDIEDDELTDDELRSVTTDDTIGREIISVSMGGLFDLWCIKKFDGNIEKAMIYANAVAIKHTIGMKWYTTKTSIDERARSIIKKINTKRIEKGWL